jgi:GntR family transcriptional regulator
MSGAPILRIDVSSSVPAYRQIAGGIRAMLVGGAFRPGDVLPTIRKLATDLGIHPNTVAEAYRMLADEGWVDLRRRRGATVLDRPSPEPAAEVTSTFARRIEELVAEAVAAGVRPGELADHLKVLERNLARGKEERS